MDCYSEIDVDMHPIWICLCGTPKCWKGKFVGQISPRGLQQVDEGMYKSLIQITLLYTYIYGVDSEMGFCWTIVSFLPGG